jgi:hypothetical protein
MFSSKVWANHSAAPYDIYLNILVTLNEDIKSSLKHTSLFVPKKQKFHNHDTSLLS